MNNLEMRKLVVKATEAMCKLPDTYSQTITASPNWVYVALYTYEGNRISKSKTFEAWYDDDYIKKSIELDKLVRKIKALKVHEK